MSYIVLSDRERDELVDLFFNLRTLGERYPLAQEEAMTALRCLKAVHSNSIEDKTVDRVFLQVMLHRAGVPNKASISRHYGNAATELLGQDELLRWLEFKAVMQQPISLFLIQEMHRITFYQSNPDMAGKFRQSDVQIRGMRHRPPHHRQIPDALHQHLAGINSDLFDNQITDKKSFLQALKTSAQVHYLVASVHPFEDGNGRVARAAGDYVMLAHGCYYDVIMSDYRDVYLDALEACTWADTDPLFHFLEFSYLETLRRISGFFNLVKRDRANG